MNDHTINRKARHGSTALQMPLQAAPINRDVSPATLVGTPSVEASWAFLPALAAWGGRKLLKAALR